MSVQIEDLTQSAQVAAAEKLKTAAKETSKPADQAAAVSALEPESDSDEEVCWLVLMFRFHLTDTSLHVC